MENIATAKINPQKHRLAVAVIAILVLISATVFFVSQSGEPPPEVGDIIEFGEHSWLVLEVREGGRFERHRVLIITEDIIGLRAYHHSTYSLTRRRVTWETSDIRRYLNNDFYNSFTEQERRRIAEIIVLNDNNPWLPQVRLSNNDTVDKIFLLSLRQVVRYFGNSGQLAAGPNHPDNTSVGFHDQYSSYRIAHSADGIPDALWWWLRCNGLTHASAIDYDGFLRVNGYMVNFPWGGVRPALWLYF